MTHFLSKLCRPNLCVSVPKPSPCIPIPTLSSSSKGDLTLDDVERLQVHVEKLQVLGHGNSVTVYQIRHKRTSYVHALKSTLDILLKNKVAAVARQALVGLSYLHENKIVHRDIKPTNLLVNQNMEVKISDFGVSKVLSRKLDTCDSYVGTGTYMGPERFNPDSYGGNYNGYAADIWSLGLTLFELYVGRRFPLLPADQRPEWAELMCAICFNDPPDLPESASDEFRSFMWSAA